MTDRWRALRELEDCVRDSRYRGSKHLLEFLREETDLELRRIVAVDRPSSRDRSRPVLRILEGAAGRALSSVRRRWSR